MIVRFSLRSLFLAMTLFGILISILLLIGQIGIALIIYIALIGLLSRLLPERLAWASLAISLVMALCPLLGVGEGTMYLRVFGYIYIQPANGHSLPFLTKIVEIPARIIGLVPGQCSDLVFWPSVMMVRREAIVWSWLATCLGILLFRRYNQFGLLLKNWSGMLPKTCSRR
jgi:hypothetical protein